MNMRLRFIYVVCALVFATPYCAGFPATRTLVKPHIHVFGDSHAYHFFSDNYTNDYVFNYKDLYEVPFSVHWLGAKTMHGLGRAGIIDLNVQRYNLQSGDVAVFTCGEIDVRCHIGKQRDVHNRDLAEIISGLVEPYIRLIATNRAFYYPLYCVVMGILPPCNACFNPQFPFYGTLQDRVEITHLLNAALKKAAEQQGMLFVSVHDLYGLPDGTLNLELSDNCVHVHMSKNYLIKNKLIAELRHHYNLFL